MRQFYVVLAVIAVAGGVLIARAASNRSPELTSDTEAPLASGQRGVVMGSDSAKIEVMEFSDFECPWCGRFAVLAMPDVKQRLVATGRVRWRFVHFPLQGHRKSPYAHLAAACANEQGKFWEMHDILYQNQEEWVNGGNLKGIIDGYADGIGLDRPRYRSCVQNRSAWGRVRADKALGDSLGLNGTPTFFINRRLLNENPSADRLVHIVDSLAPLSAASPAPRR